MKRREIMEAGAGAGLLAIAAVCLAKPDRVSQVEKPTSDDADLIAACAAFDVLERRYQHICNVEFRDDDDASDAAVEALKPEHDAALDRVCAHRPTTLEGFRALAATALLEDEVLAARVADGDDDGDYVNCRLLNTLLRALAPGNAA